MAVNYDPEKEDFVSDKVSIKKWANNEQERRRALMYCLENDWADEEIGCLERVENSVRWGWRMYAYRSGKTGPPGDE